VDVEARAEVQGLSIAQQQMVEVTKALSLNADLIAMDEPTSALSERETEVLFDVMRSLKAQGVSLIFISHRLGEVFQIADRVTVLRDGQCVGTAPIAELDEDQVVRMMVGRELGEMYPRPRHSLASGRPWLARYEWKVARSHSTHRARPSGWGWDWCQRIASYKGSL
jgi:ABC-type sugar transport system ATPase subunit